MTHHLEKETPFIFSKECIEAFETLKMKLTQAPILVAPDWDLPFEIMCDASDFAVGAVLGQRKTKHFQPIHYASKTMTEAQAHYTTTEKELLVVVMLSQDCSGGFCCSKNLMLSSVIKKEQKISPPTTFLDLKIPIKVSSRKRKLIKSSVEDLVHTPSESDGIPKSECNLPVCDDSSSKKDEVLDDIISIPPGNGNDHFNAEYSLIEFVLNCDNVISSPKIDFLLEEFAGKLAFIALIPPGIVEAGFDPKGDIHFIEKLMYDNSFPRPPKTLKDDYETVIDSNNDYSSSDNDSLYSDDIDYTFCFNLEEKSSGNPTSYTDLSLPDYGAFFCDSEPDSEVFTMDSFVIKSPIPVENGDSFLEKFETTPELETFKFDIKEKNSGSTTIHADISLPDLECFYFKSKPDPAELTSIIDPEIRENISSTTNVNLPFEDDQSPLFAYVVWIFLSFLTYPVTPPYLLSSGNEDTIFDPGISIYHSFMPGVSHRSGTFMKFNVYPNHLNESPMEILSSTCSPMDQ
ncbi:zf-CCHC domain-containing protein [Tanacetum coccineum]